MLEPEKLESAVSSVRMRLGPAPKSVKIILVVCSGNICRSPMGEVYLIHKLEEKGIQGVKVYSAGTLNITGEPADPKAIATAMDAGLDLRNHSSYGIDHLPVGYADIVLTMEPQHSDYVAESFPAAKEKTHLLGEFYPRDFGATIPDPIGGSLEDFHNSFDMIRDSIDVFVAWLQAGAGR